MNDGNGHKALKKKPWLKFYPQDWRGDAKLQSCSIGARGLWMEMVCIMHEAEPYGHLLLGGIAVSPKRLAVLAGITEKECLTFILELGTAGVFSRDERNIILSRRMVRDDERSSKGRSDVEKRWEAQRRAEEAATALDPISHPMPDPNSPPIRVPIRGAMATPITPESRDQKEDDDGDARASEPLLSPVAMQLAEELLIIAGHDPKFWPPGWCGAPMRVQTWLTSGWPRETIVVAVKAAMGRKRDGPPGSVQYFERAIAAEVALQATPLPTVEVRQPEKMTVTAHGKQSAGNIIQASDRLVETIRSFDAGPSGPVQIRSGEGEADVRLLSKG